MKRWVIRLSVLAGATLVALVMAEGLLRVLDLVPVEGVMTVNESEFDRLPGLFVPGQAITAAPGSRFPHRVTIDSLGYRGVRAVSRRPAPGEFRVLYAGDSFTFGHNVHDEETLPAQLEEVLNQGCPGARVINAGVSGFTILGEAEQVRRGLVLEPDVVVVMSYENDLGELAHVRIWDQLALNRKVKSRFPVSVVYRVMRESALWRLALKSTLAARQRLGARMAGDPALTDPVEPAAGQAATSEDALAPAREEYRRRLAELSDELERVGIPLVFVVFPSPESTRSDTPRDEYAWAVSTGRELGLPTVGLRGVLRSSDRSVEELYLVPHDYHPSPLGHRVAAEAVATGVVEADLGRERCGR